MRATYSSWASQSSCWKEDVCDASFWFACKFTSASEAAAAVAVVAAVAAAVELDRQRIPSLLLDKSVYEMLLLLPRPPPPPLLG